MRPDPLKWATLLVVTAALGTLIYYRYQDMQPCVHPVRYAVGAIDPRFGIATSTVVSEAEAAAKIWNTAEKRDVLVYDPHASLRINFVYDERESAARLGLSLAREQVALDATRSSLDATKARYDAQQAAYNQEVADINAHGGATRQQAAALDAERSTLEELASSIQAEVAAYNASVKSFNATVAEYNQTAEHTFAEGEFIEDSAGERIEIYEFVDAMQLERVLAHELGHALGLEHNDDPASIMYAKNESGNLVPTAADLSALKALCGVHG